MQTHDSRKRGTMKNKSLTSSFLYGSLQQFSPILWNCHVGPGAWAWATGRGTDAALWPTSIWRWPRCRGSTGEPRTIHETLAWGWGKVRENHGKPNAIFTDAEYQFSWILGWFLLGFATAKYDFPVEVTRSGCFWDAQSSCGAVGRDGPTDDPHRSTHEIRTRKEIVGHIQCIAETQTFQLCQKTAGCYSRQGIFVWMMSDWPDQQKELENARNIWIHLNLEI